MEWPVLLLARELDLGGSERQLTEIAKTLDRSRFEPHVGCFRPQGIRAAELAACGVLGRLVWHAPRLCPYPHWRTA